MPKHRVLGETASIQDGQQFESTVLQPLRSRVTRGFIVNLRKLENGLRPNSAGIPYTLLLRIEAIGFPTFGLLL